MARGDVDDDPLLLAVGNIFKNLGQFEVMGADLVPRIDVFYEVKKALLAQILGYLGVIGLQKLKNTTFLLVGHLWQRLPQLK